MLHVIILILKIVGILLLAILGLLIALILILLLVPIRYRGQGSFDSSGGEMRGTVRFTWLLHLLSVRFTFRGEPEIRIFGFPAFRGKKEETDGETGSEEDFPDGRETILSDEREGILSAEDSSGRDGARSPMEDPILTAQEAGRRPEGADTPEPGPEPKPGESQAAPGPFGRILHRIRGFFSRLRQAVRDFCHRLLDMLRNLCDTWKRAEAGRQAILAFLQDEANQKTWRLIKKQLGKVLRHLWPVRLKGNVVFGFDEPYVTGQILTGAALLYPLYRDSLVIQPVFDRQVLEGELSFRGRVRLGTLLMAALLIWRDKNFRKQFKRFQNRGEM